MIVLTKHAEIRLQERGITKQQVAAALDKPDFILPARSGRQVAIRKIGNRYLKTVFAKQNGAIIVITSHWISRVKQRSNHES